MTSGTRTGWLLVGLLAAVAAVITSTGEPLGARPLPPAASPPAAPLRASHPPLHLEWTRAEQAAGRLELAARLVFSAAVGSPVHVQLGLPPGVALLSGPERLDVDPPAEGSALDLQWEVATPPGADGEIVVEADVRGDGFGVHAKKAHPLGAAARARAEARAAVRLPRGTDLVVRGRSFGPSIPLDR